MSFHPSVTPFSQCSCHHIFMKFSGVIIIDKSDAHAKDQGHRLKELLQFWCFWTVTPGGIHRWIRNDAQSFKYHIKGALLVVKVINQVSRSHGTKINFEPNGAFPDCNSRLNSPMALKWSTKLDGAWKRCPIIFWGHPSNFKVIWEKIDNLNPFWVRLLDRLQLSGPSDLPCCCVGSVTVAIWPIHFIYGTNRVEASNFGQLLNATYSAHACLGFHNPMGAFHTSPKCVDCPLSKYGI